MTFARDRGFEREAVMDERAFFVDAMRRGMGETTYPEVRASFEARVASGEFQLVAGEKHDSARRFTTAETIKAEKEIVQKVLDGQGRAPQLMSIQQAIPLTGGASPTQPRRSGTPSNRCSLPAIGYRDCKESPAAGKTTTLASIRQGAEQNGYAVEGFAPTSRAAPPAPRCGH